MMTVHSLNEGINRTVAEFLESSCVKVTSREAFPEFTNGPVIDMWVDRADCTFLFLKASDLQAAKYWLGLQYVVDVMTQWGDYVAFGGESSRISDAIHEVMSNQD